MESLAWGDPIRECAKKANAPETIYIFFTSACLHQHCFCKWAEIKKTETCVSAFLCGERGIRTPGPVTVNSFQDCRNRPLCHFSRFWSAVFSGANIDFFPKPAKYFCKKFFVG